MSERKVTLYVKSEKRIKKVEEFGYETVTVLQRTAYGGTYYAPPRVFPTRQKSTTKITENVLPEDQKKAIDLVTEVASKYGFNVEVIDITKENFLEREFLEYHKRIKVFPTITIDDEERIEGKITRKQIEALLSEAMAHN